MTKIVAALSHLLEIRVGIPRPGGALAAAARALGYKVMVSANSFLIRDKFGEPARVRRPGTTFAGLDAALRLTRVLLEKCSDIATQPIPFARFVHGCLTIELRCGADWRAQFATANWVTGRRVTLNEVLDHIALEDPAEHEHSGYRRRLGSKNDGQVAT